MRPLGMFSSRVAALLAFFAAIPACWAADEAETAPPGRGLVYVIARDTGSYASVLLSVNGKVVETLDPNSYVVIAVNPGQLRLGSAGSGLGSFELSTVAGGIYYVQFRIPANGILEFQPLSESDAHTLLAQSRNLGHVGTVLPAVAAPVAKSAPAAVFRLAEPAFEDKQAVAIILKGGAYTVAEERQPLDTSTAPLDTKAISPFGLEVEWRYPDGFATGGEVFYLRNKWTDSTPGLTGHIDTLAVTINGKYYLGIARVVYPYLGVGLGYAVSSFSGVGRANAGGFACQGLTGVEFRFKYIGLNLGYKYLFADVKSNNSLGQTETNPMGGSGPLLGLTIHIPIH